MAVFQLVADPASNDADLIIGAFEKEKKNASGESLKNEPTYIFSRFVTPKQKERGGWGERFG